MELVSGHSADLWPRPGRVFAAARSHSFAQFATAIDLAFGRWDLAHLHLFTLSDGARVSPLHWWDGEAPDGTVDGHTTKLSRLQPGEQFAYVFDMGDDWANTCAQWRKSASILSPSSAKPPTALFPTGVGAASRTRMTSRCVREMSASGELKRPWWGAVVAALGETKLAADTVGGRLEEVDRRAYPLTPRQRSVLAMTRHRWASAIERMRRPEEIGTSVRRSRPVKHQLGEDRVDEQFCGGCHVDGG
ncbi:plasmid pRiA4b ORF-3 family protein [Streptomyces phaeochromogenes]|nr:plasmid pRiA4b ORF-3 family protein [Streptomyces phaeochromogenes]